MDDILASIRRILNEDEATVARPPASPDAGEPIDLTESMLVSPPPVVPVPVAAPAEPEPEQPARAPEPSVSGGLVAPAVAAATTAALGHLLRTVAAERTAPLHRGGGPSIEDVVREEVRPLLKDWLDQHLPPLVERLVRAEIERVIGRAL
jgi:hypothetical protein